MKVELLKDVTGKINKDGRQRLTTNQDELMTYTFAKKGEVLNATPTAKVYNRPSGLLTCVNRSGHLFVVTSAMIKEV